MTKQKPSTAANLAWTVTMGTIRTAADMGHCQFRGSVVVLEPDGDSMSMFTATINPNTDAELQQEFFKLALKASANNWAEDEMNTYTKQVKLFDPPTHKRKNVKRRTWRVPIAAQSATLGGRLVTIVMHEDDMFYAQAFATTMAAALVAVNLTNLDRRPKEIDTLVDFRGFPRQVG